MLKKLVKSLIMIRLHPCDIEDVCHTTYSSWLTSSVALVTLFPSAKAIALKYRSDCIKSLAGNLVWGWVLKCSKANNEGICLPIILFTLGEGLNRNSLVVVKFLTVAFKHETVPRLSQRIYLAV